MQNRNIFILHNKEPKSAPLPAASVREIVQLNNRLLPPPAKVANHSPAGVGYSIYSASNNIESNIANLPHDTMSAIPSLMMLGRR